MRLLKRGAMLCLVLALSSCRKSIPPQIEICILDGAGGGDCIEPDGSKRYRAPTDMGNYWATSQEDISAFSSWCYGTKLENAKAMMGKIEEEARSP